MPARRLVLFGAGMTGRGQVAQLAFEDGWELVLVDRDRDLVDRLNRAGQYTVRLLGEGARDVVVSGYTALHTDEEGAIGEAVASADLVVTSVLEPNLPDVARTLAPALAARARNGGPPLNVIAAENMSNSSTVLGQYVRGYLPQELRDRLEACVGFPNSMIARVVPLAADPLLIVGESYSEWTADRFGAVGELPRLAGLDWVDNQTARLERKLFVHNTGHAVCGYLGWLAGYRYVHEAAQDAAIQERIRRAIGESGEAVARKHGFDRAEVRAYEDNLISRLVVPDLPDDLRRVIRQPLRKLGREERLVGPLLLCEEYDLPREGLCMGVAAVLRSRMPGDEQFERVTEMVTRLGPVAALQELVGYVPRPDTARLITAAYEELGYR